MTKLVWKNTGGDDFEAYENGYTMRVEVDGFGITTWRVGEGPPDLNPDWIVEGSLVQSNTSARRIARRVARVLANEKARLDDLQFQRRVKRTEAREKARGMK